MAPVGFLFQLKSGRTSAPRLPEACDDGGFPSPFTRADVYRGKADRYFALTYSLRPQIELVVISFSQLQKADFGERICFVGQQANQPSALFNKLIHINH